MKHSKYVVLILFIFVSVLVFTGCKKAPDAEQSAAQAALNTAMKEGAEQFAPIEMEAGKMLLSVSDGQMREEKFTEAKVGYLAAREFFEKAVQSAVTAKQAMAQEINTTLSALEAEWKVIEENVAAVDAKMRDQLKEIWALDSVAFAEGLQVAKGIVASDVTNAKTKAEELSELANKWKEETQRLANE